ncbi:RNA polymerase subunit sigma-70 [Xanthobacter agilis]|uniref:RNA polymerase sigma-70 factor (ECF subfamily) n=1 Tax=Xanthobacter agilis TaxID=47492 RepID=A0ABU0LC70_XANAG|nr:RNA polymerase subunit sigma-70 [Xanthobacter agilis]MDQ0504716.1 RNA polymerase sigma-70 factor (ECF subfamily) [Xanthobacter agilis]
MTPHRELRALLAAAGDAPARERIYALSSPKLYGLVLRLLRQPELAADAMRRAYRQIFHRAAALAAEPDPLSAMVAIARTVALDVAREHGGVDVFEPFRVSQSADDPLALNERSKVLMRLLAGLGTLSEERRRMLLLAYYDGWTRDALGMYFDVPAAGVRAWLTRSIQQLATALGLRS